ncbi:YheT family hydrolase [Tunicatimonas pelagia]|uniref:YheT family hydrolase n=1 Tax=Tunicatimonas pelagia TaxID=931531 RepID=UPI0026650848|nr:alpha/beta fold hydrolase [Tunicatimonas pelagia]WKN43125.1 alpha/beta fold hydrolase [Tunicatimonas pelagia]
MGGGLMTNIEICDSVPTFASVSLPIMPLLTSSDYRPPRYLFNGHLQTIIPSQFRKIREISYSRERISTEDGDFLLLDWSSIKSSQLVIVSHGLEGDSHRPYILGMVRAFNRAGFDALAWNFRGCGGEINQTYRFYHSGATPDLHFLVNYVKNQYQYKSIVLVGFSLGGNLTLKYLGEQREALVNEVQAAVVFSVPLDLQACSRKIAEPENFIYSKRFLRNLKKKIRNKEAIMPDKISSEFFPQIRSLEDFDNYYTAPLHGFRNAADYYHQCSSIRFLQSIRVPTLVVSAKNDPFLAPECYLTKESETTDYLHFQAPESGGHCGFMPRSYSSGQNFWSENRAVEFVNDVLVSHNN